MTCMHRLATTGTHIRAHTGMFDQPVSMFDGFETSRSHDWSHRLVFWLVVRLVLWLVIWLVLCYRHSTREACHFFFIIITTIYIYYAQGGSGG